MGATIIYSTLVRNQTSKAAARGLDRPYAVLQRVYRLLERAEPQTGAGILAFHQAQQGRGDIVIWDRRICLVAETIKPRLLQQVAAEEPSIGELLLQLQQRALDHKVRFGDVVLAMGAPVVARVRQGLLALSAHCLISLAQTHVDDEVEICRLGPREAPAWQTAWMPTRPDYNKVLTFSMLEVFEEAARRLDDAPADVASRVFERFASLCDRAFLLWESPDGDTAVPLRVEGEGLDKLSDLRKAAYAAHRLSRPLVMRMAKLKPNILTFGKSWSECVCVSSGRRIAVLIGSDVEARAHIAQGALSGALR